MILELKSAQRSGKTTRIIFPPALKIDFLDVTNSRIILMVLYVCINISIYMCILRYYKCFNLSRQGSVRLDGAQNSLSSELQVVIFTLLKVKLTTEVVSYS